MSSPRADDDGSPASCLSALLAAKDELAELIQISAIKASHERDLLERLDGLAQQARLLNTAWKLQVDEEEEAVEELKRQKAKAAGEVEVQVEEKSRLQDENKALREEADALRRRQHEILAEADTRVQRAVEREREAAEAWKATLLKEARAMMEGSLAAERRRHQDAHKAGIEAVLASAEKEESSRLSAVQQTLTKAEEARQQALKKAADAQQEKQRAEIEVASLQRRLSSLEQQHTALRTELSLSLGKVAEEQERNKHLTHLLSLSRQGHQEFARLVEQRHAGALQAKDASLEAALDAERARLNKEVDALRQRCEGMLREDRKSVV